MQSFLHSVLGRLYLPYIHYLEYPLADSLLFSTIIVIKHDKYFSSLKNYHN
jgi:hypothetical protein